MVHQPVDGRCSLRSRGGPDVSRIAAQFRGGGHTMAAGTFLPGPLENAKKSILAEMKKWFDRLTIPSDAEGRL